MPHPTCKNCGKTLLIFHGVQMCVVKTCPEYGKEQS